MIILINNPYSLISTSFLLTYGGTIGIIYFQKIVEKIIKNIKIKNRRWKYVYSFFWKYVQVNISFLPTGDRTYCPGQMVLL